MPHAVAQLGGADHEDGWKIVPAEGTKTWGPSPHHRYKQDDHTEDQGSEAKESAGSVEYSRQAAEH